MCNHPNSGFYTGYKNPDSGNDVIFHTSGKIDMVSLAAAHRKYDFIKTDPPYDYDFVRVVKGVPMLYQRFPVPCGHCIGCKVSKAREWSVRCSLEASMYQDNMFLTLTYNPENYPSDVAKLKTHLSAFMKRLRSMYGEGIRFFACCEKGETFGRFHFHVIIFNFAFPDLEFYQMHGQHPYYRSKSLERLWPFGFSYVGEAHPNNISYVARYVEKKQSEDPDPNEFILMSRRPGIGRPWFDSHQDELKRLYKVYGKFAHDGCLPPKYFDEVMKKLDPVYYGKVKADKRRIGELQDFFWMYTHNLNDANAGFEKDRICMDKKKKRNFL